MSIFINVSCNPGTSFEDAVKEAVEDVEGNVCLVFNGRTFHLWEGTVVTDLLHENSLYIDDIQI